MQNNVPDDEVNKITFENAMRWYHWDPFTHISREQSTVGALRKAAEGHDVSIQALSPPQEGLEPWGFVVAGTTGQGHCLSEVTTAFSITHKSRHLPGPPSTLLLTT